MQLGRRCSSETPQAIQGGREDPSRAESIKVSIGGMKPATLRAGLRRALKDNADAKMAQPGNAFGSEVRETSELVLSAPG